LVWWVWLFVECYMWIEHLVVVKFLGHMVDV